MSLTPNPNLPPHEQAFVLDSAHVNDAFSVRISLPPSYPMNDASYPVFYVLDGDHSFGLAATVQAYMGLGANYGMGRNIPEMIVVGIGYDRGPIPWLFTRVRDFTPTEDPSFNYDNPQFSIPESGKAEPFLAMIRQELQPALRERLRIDEATSVLAGHSLAGAFGMHTMLRPEPVFSKYLLVSPFVGWGQRALFRAEAEFFEQHDALSAEAFFAVSGQEPTPTYIDEVTELCKVLGERGYDGFRFQFRHYAGDNHFSMWPKAFMEGLEFLFAEAG